METSRYIVDYIPPPGPIRCVGNVIKVQSVCHSVVIYVIKVVVLAPRRMPYLHIRVYISILHHRVFFSC